MDQPSDLEEEQQMIEANIIEFMKAARQHLLELMPIAQQSVANLGCKGC